MARSDILTHIPLDYWAMVYGLDLYRFNQVDAPVPDEGCEHIWCQRAPGYGAEGRYHLRDLLAQALQQAEQRIGRYLGSPVAPAWVQDEHAWPERGVGLFETKRFRVLEFGRPEWTFVGHYPVVYAGDYGYVTVPPADYDGDPCELTLIGYDATYLDDLADCLRESYAIRPIRITSSAAGIIIRAHKAQFVQPALWETCEPLDPDDDIYLANAQVWRVAAGVGEDYSPAEIVTTEESCEHPCVDATVKGCALTGSPLYIGGGHRVRAWVYPATWDGSYWVSASTGLCTVPIRARLYYRSGVMAENPLCCEMIDRTVGEAVARLATAYLPHSPCGCEAVSQMFEHDRALMRTGGELNAPRDPIAYQNPFGDSWAAQNAWQVVRSIRPNAVQSGGGAG